MNADPYLIFEMTGFPYGIDAYCVHEIFFIPTITIVPECPPDMIGVINLRGEILPILDLNRHFGYGVRTYHLNDNIIVISWQGQQIGLLVDTTDEIKQIAEAEQNATVKYMNGRPRTQYFVKGIARQDSRLITLLNAEVLVQYGRGKANLIDRTELEQTEQLDEMSGVPGSTHFFSTATSEDWQILDQRADNLRQNLQDKSDFGLLPFAVIGLQGEWFGLGLDAIYEFTNIQTVTQIPCCPPHIVGNINLRGEILTLVDISYLLNLPIEKLEIRNQAIVVRFNSLVAGIIVDQVVDVTYLHMADLAPIPATVRSVNDEYILGVASYHDRPISVLDLPKILASPDLVVDEVP